MKKIIITINVFIILAIAFVLAAILTVDYQKALKEFAVNANIDISQDNLINDYRVRKFPVPYLQIKQIKVPKVGELRDIEIDFSLLSILQFSPKISTLKIEEAKLYLQSDNVNIINHDQLISDIINRSNININVAIRKVSFVESDDDISLELNHFNLTSYSETGKMLFKARGHNHEEISGSLEKKDVKTKFNLNIQATDYKLDLSEIYDSGILAEGAVNITTTNLPEYISSFSPMLNQIKQDKANAAEVKINFDIIKSENGLKLHNILIDSEYLKGKGECDLSQNPEISSKFNLVFSLVDLVSWQKTQDPVIKDNSSISDLKINNSYSSRNIGIVEGNINIEELKLSPHLNLNKVFFSFSDKSGSLYIDNFFGKINNDGSFKIFGHVEQNDFRKLFIGNFLLEGADLNDIAEFISDDKKIRIKEKVAYNISSDLKLSAVDLLLRNLVISTGDSQINGNISTKFIGNSSRSNGDLQISYINFDKPNYPVMIQVYEYLLSLTNNMKDSEYLNKFILLRKIKGISNHNIKIDKMIVDSKVFENISFNIELAPGDIKISNLYIKDNKDYILGDIALATNSIKPSLMIKIKDGSLGVDSLSPQSMLNLKDFIVNNIALEKIDTQLSLTLRSLYDDTFEVKRLVFVAKNNKNLLEVSNLNADIFGGRMVSSGSILLSPYTMNFVYSLGGVKIDQIKKIMPNGLIDTYGTMNARGMWNSSGNKLNELLYNLYINSSVTIKDSMIRNFSIDNLIQILSNPKYEKKNFSEDLKRAMLVGDTEIKTLNTSFELNKGVISMPLMKFDTKYAKVTGDAQINIYDFSLNAQSEFSFQVATANFGKSNELYNLSKLKLKTSGTIFAPKKDADASNVTEIISNRTRGF